MLKSAYDLICDWLQHYNKSTTNRTSGRWTLTFAHQLRIACRRPFLSCCLSQNALRITACLYDLTGTNLYLSTRDSGNIWSDLAMAASNVAPSGDWVGTGVLIYGAFGNISPLLSSSQSSFGPEEDVDRFSLFCRTQSDALEQSAAWHYRLCVTDVILPETENFFVFYIISMNTFFFSVVLEVFT